MKMSRDGCKDNLVIIILMENKAFQAKVRDRNTSKLYSEQRIFMLASYLVAKLKIDRESK